MRCQPLDAIARHFFTARELRLRGDDEETAQEWGSVAREMGVRPEALRRMRQVHGCAVVAVHAGDPPGPGAPRVDGPPGAPQASPPAGAQASARASPQADGIVSVDPDVALAVQVADCVPLLMADRRTGAVAATHAGWRGAAANIAGAAVRHLVERFAVHPHDLVAAIGPSIGPCCYQVGPDVKAAFLQRAGALRDVEATAAPPQVDTWFRPDPADPRGDRLKLDMWQANHDQLVAAGLLPERIHVARLCTASHVDRFHSYRVEGASAGRLLGVIRSRGPRGDR